MNFPDYHGMNLGQGGDAALFLVIAHEHGHVMDMSNMKPHDREATASAHATSMIKHAPIGIYREIKDEY